MPLPGPLDLTIKIKQQTLASFVGVGITLELVYSQELISANQVQDEMEITGMRTVFSIDLKADIAGGDEETSKLLLDLCLGHAQGLFSQASMVLKKTPTIGVKSSDSTHGQVDHKVFDGEGEASEG